MITMLSNDFGYDKAYEKFLEYYVEKESLVIIMSSGGESPNMLNCLNWCEKENDLHVAAMAASPEATCSCDMVRRRAVRRVV